MDPLLQLLALCLLAATSGVLGTLLLLRRQGLLLSAVGHATLPGLGGVLLITGGALPAYGALVGSAACTGLLAAGLVAWLARRPGFRPDTAQAVVLGLAFGAGAVLWSLHPQWAPGTEAASFDWQPWLFGQLAALGATDAAWLVTTCIGGLAGVALAAPQLNLVAFSPDQARMQGLPVPWLDAGLLVLVSLVAVLAIKAVGLLLVVGLFLTPAAAARRLCSGVSSACALAAALGAMAGLFGVLSSEWIPWLPAGPSVILWAALLLALSAGIRLPRRTSPPNSARSQP